MKLIGLLMYSVVWKILCNLCYCGLLLFSHIGTYCWHYWWL